MNFGIIFIVFFILFFLSVYLSVYTKEINEVLNSITIDNQTVDLSAIDLAKVLQPTWGSDLSLSITTESENASNNCDKVFFWDTYYRNINLSFKPTITSITDNSHCVFFSLFGHILPIPSKRVV